MLLGLLFIALVIWLMLRSAAGGLPEDKIKRSASERGWEVVSITDQSSFIFKTSRYRVLYTDGSSPAWRETFCNPSIFGVIWFGTEKSSFWLSRLP